MKVLFSGLYRAKKRPGIKSVVIYKKQLFHVYLELIAAGALVRSESVRTYSRFMISRRLAVSSLI